MSLSYILKIQGVSAHDMRLILVNSGPPPLSDPAPREHCSPKGEGRLHISWEDAESRIQ